MLQSEAAELPVPARKYFHIGQPEVMDDVGECVPMIAWTDDNLSRYVVSDAPTQSWGKNERFFIVPLPNLEVKSGEGVFLIASGGDDSSAPHPTGKGRMHFVHLGLVESLAERKTPKLYVYRLEGVQVHGLKPRGA